MSTLSLTIVVTYDHVEAHLVDPDNGRVIESTSTSTPPTLWSPPIKLNDADSLKYAIVESITAIKSARARRARLVMLPAYHVEKPADAQDLQELRPTDPIEVGMYLKENPANELDDELELAAAEFSLGPTPYYFAVDATAVYTVADALLGLGITLEGALPYVVASLRYAFPEGFANKIWAIIEGNSLLTPHAKENSFSLSRRLLSASHEERLAEITQQISFAAVSLNEAHTFTSGPPLDVYVSAPDGPQLAEQLSSSLNMSVTAIANSPALGAARDKPYTGDLLPTALRPKPYSKAWALASAWVLVAFVWALFASASTSFTILQKEHALEDVNNRYRALQPYLDAQRLYRGSIARIRQLQDLYNKASAQEIHWSQIVPVFSNRIGLEKDVAGTHVKNLQFKLTGNAVSTSLSGSAPSKAAFLALLRTFDKPPFKLTFRSSDVSEEGAVSFSLSTEAPLRTISGHDSRETANAK